MSIFEYLKGKKIGWILVLVILLLICWPFSSVPTGSRGVVTQFGSIVGVKGEGLVILPPWQKLSVFNVRSSTVDVDGAEGSTSDTQPVHVSLTVRYNINPNKVSEVFENYTHDGDLSSFVQTAVQESFKVVTARYTATDLVSKRAEVSTALRAVLAEKLATYGANVINIDMRNFKYSDSYMGAINQKVTQEQLRLAAENELKTVEAKQKQKVAVAEAEAAATVATAKAEAEALRVKSQAISQNRDVLELNRIQVEMTKAEKWDGKLPQNIYAGAPMPFLNVK